MKISGKGLKMEKKTNWDIPEEKNINITCSPSYMEHNFKSLFFFSSTCDSCRNEETRKEAFGRMKGAKRDMGVGGILSKMKRVYQNYKETYYLLIQSNYLYKIGLEGKWTRLLRKFIFLRGS